MSTDSVGWKAKKLENQRPHDEENARDEPHQKKQHLEENHTEGLILSGVVPGTPGKTILVHDSQGQSGNSSDPNASLFRALKNNPGQRGWTHNKQLGFRKTQELRNKDRDQDGDLEMSEEPSAAKLTCQSDETDNSQEVEKEEQWTVVAHQRERALAVRVAHADLHGNTVKERLQDLKELLMDLKVNPTTTPTTMRIDGIPYFRVPVATQRDLDILLEGMIENNQEEKHSEETDDGISQEMIDNDEAPEELPVRQFFELVDVNAERQHSFARSIELYGLPARVNMELLEYSANQLGAVEGIELRGCHRGLKMTATVTFEDADDVLTLLEEKARHVRVGPDLVRIRRLGEERLTWNLDIVHKLHGIPRDTNPSGLQSTLEMLGIKVDFVEIPRRYVNNGTQIRYLKEAFVYFETEQDAEVALSKNIKIGYSQLKWLNPTEKRCYTCNEPMHVGKCPTLMKRIDERTHQKRVMEFHKASQSRVNVGTSFADLLKGKGTHSVEKTQMKKETAKNSERGRSVDRKENTRKNDKSKERKANTRATSSADDHFPSLSGSHKSETTKPTYNKSSEQVHEYDVIIAEMKDRQQKLEETMSEMKNTILQMAKAHNSALESMQRMMEEMKGMFSRAFSNNQVQPSIEVQASQASQLSTSSYRSDTPLQDNRPSKVVLLADPRATDKPNPFLPSSTESRAKIEGRITRNQIRSKIGGTSTSGGNSGGPSPSRNKSVNGN
ncbi:hypothetical protein BGZ49_003891 [Haplosporangium sp. Z 27]|nr:hypothetical protein BGZ49_003891 [Haplosporangium sp. Z 27]